MVNQDFGGVVAPGGPGGGPATVEHHIADPSTGVINTARTGYVPSQAAAMDGGIVRGRAYDHAYMALKNAVLKRISATGLRPYTLVSFLPIPLIVCSPMESLRVRIAPAPHPEDVAAGRAYPFSWHTWDQPAIEVMERGENTKQPWEYHPIQLAQEFLEQYKEYGGIYLFEGYMTKEVMESDKFQEGTEACKEGMFVWMRSKIEEANAEWNSPNHMGAKNIVEYHRLCAMWLKQYGIIDNLPEWITEARRLQDVQAKCPRCKNTPQAGALTCTVCNEILDPAQAFTEGFITEEHAALERLTRKQVEELGCSAFVAETADERPERVKQGLPRPLSIAQKRALQSQAQKLEGEEPGTEGRNW
jgi:hypothetical protein